ncbi:sensor histidine kinase [Pedobacter montanisoli]|uniref:histidine kinase n=1 Tax=Pedobacter montanisoli TaxID=2923277 RepID=A0ABS9ZX78_9SPHI|nr:HAMP domain-containing sensor histidine kinase [Pedobacter montanisoli]MCJ0742898.1 HAMP domain-containing histidine kinase [Pedobacter montanisoli]
MLSFILYKTPQKYFKAFDTHYSLINLKQVKVISACILVLALFARLIGVLFYAETSRIPNYDEYSLSNWIQLLGSGLFWSVSSYILNVQKNSLTQRKITVFLFILFQLLISLGISYTVSHHNTKNTLTMLLVGILVVSIFFVIELREIIFISIFLALAFIFAIVFPKIALEEKLINIIAGVTLSFILFCFSRHTYQSRSAHFIKIKELEEKNEEIALLNTQKTNILSFVAHDLRGPLNNIDALSSLMLLENEDNAEAKMIQSSASQAKNIINDLIEGIKQGDDDFKKEEISLNDLLQQIVKKWKINSDRLINFTLPEEETFIMANPSKLERVLDNLISNALKFSPKSTAIKVNLYQEENHAVVGIQDFGIGINQNMQNYIFDQFSKAGRKGLLGEKSIGLGLYISKQLIEKHGGSIQFTSEQNQGTTFTIKLPIA